MFACFSPFRKLSREQTGLSESYLRKISEKVSYTERWIMTGGQGYTLKECIRQWFNSFEEWDTQRSKDYFSGVVHMWFFKWASATGGNIKAHGDVWR